MQAKLTCTTCGAAITGDAPFGHCPKCLLELGFVRSAAELPASSSRFSGGLQNYELLEQIGRGGMGIVYKARHKELGRVVALKMIREEQLASPILVKRFQIEAEAAASLDHPNILPIYDIGQADGQHFYTMRFVEGTSLQATIDGDGFHLPEMAQTERERQRSVAGLIATVARAIHFAHRKGIIHRDLKPSNVLLDADNQPHLSDFGIAKVRDADLKLTITGAIVGTPDYMSPEQAKGEAQLISFASDIYSLGAMLYEMLTGRVPFRALTPMETLHKVANEEPRRLSSINRAVDRDLEIICLKCLEKDPLRRYGSAQDLAEDLERWQRHEPIRAQRTSLWLRARRWGQRNPAPTAALALMFVSLAVVSLLLGRIYQEKQKREQAITGLKEAQGQASVAMTVLRTDLGNTLNKLWTNSDRQGYEHIESEKLRIWLGPGQKKKKFHGAQPLDLIFAVYTHQKPAEMLENCGPALLELERIMEEQLAQPVEIALRIYRDYETARGALTSKEVHFMRLGPSSYVKAKQEDPGIVLLGAQNGSITGAVFTATNSGITNLTQMKGKPFAFVSQSSTTGGFLAKVQLWEAGIRAADLPGGLHYLGSHDAVAEAVASGEYAGGAGNAREVEEMIARRGLPLQIIHRFSEGPLSMPWVARGRLDPKLVESLRGALFAIKDLTALDHLGNDTTAIEPAQDSDFDQLRKAMKNSERFDAP